MRRIGLVGKRKILASARLTSRAAFEDAGAATTDFKRQIAALIDFGAVQLLELFMQKSGEKGYHNALLQFNHLRAEFGEKFKMIKFKKGL